MALHRHHFAEGIPIKDFNKALSLIDRREFNKAILLLNRVKRAKEFKEVWLNLGVAYKGVNNFPKVKECFDKALDPLMPFSDGTFKKHWAMALSNMGLYYYAREHDDMAEHYHRAAIEADKDYHDAIWNLSLAKLRQYCSNKHSDLSKAWTYYTFRFNRTNPTQLHNDKGDLGVWDFKTKGKSIVVLMEQGMGDAMMFGRYLSLLEAYFDTIWVQCTPDMDYIFSKYKTCRSVLDTDAECGIPMCSLGKIVEHIPNGEWLADKYVAKGRGDKLEILCVWEGNDEHVNSRNRNAPPGLFDKLKKFGNLHSVVDRKGYTKMPIVDWKTTIKYLENIDLVITIDSSLSHLCGSMGKPCLVLMPLNDTDFRWGDSSMGYKNVWYNSVKVIRNPGDWVATMDKVESCLQGLSTMSTTDDMTKPLKQLDAN